MNELVLEQTIFKQGSRTFYQAAQLFPPTVRHEVLRFYSFVRVVDDCVDVLPQQRRRFQALRQAWHDAIRNEQFDTTPAAADKIDERVIKNIVHIVRSNECDPAWVEAFFNAMQSDLDTKTYETLDDTLNYIYGSAEVVGLIMSQIMGLPDEALPYARLQGRAFQYINFIRDIAEDTALGRCYFPREDLDRFGLENLEQATVMHQVEDFRAFIEFQLARYERWQVEADRGLTYISANSRHALEAAISGYRAIARQIVRDPLSLFR